MQQEGSGASIADEIIANSGLAPVIASGVLRRCCSRAGLSPTSLSHRDVGKLLPLIEPLIKLYLKPEDAEGRVAALRRLCEPR